jgi:hypothetical protein
MTASGEAGPVWVERIEGEQAGPMKANIVSKKRNKRFILTPLVGLNIPELTLPNIAWFPRATFHLPMHLIQ